MAGTRRPASRDHHRPSERLVVVRLGLTHNATTGIGGVVADIIAALHGRPPPY
jgi:hypothetical protein